MISKGANAPFRPSSACSPDVKLVSMLTSPALYYSSPYDSGTIITWSDRYIFPIHTHVMTVSRLCTALCRAMESGCWEDVRFTKSSTTQNNIYIKTNNSFYSFPSPFSSSMIRGILWTGDMRSSASVCRPHSGRDSLDYQQQQIRTKIKQQQQNSCVRVCWPTHVSVPLLSEFLYPQSDLLLHWIYETLTAIF